MTNKHALWDDGRKGQVPEDFGKEGLVKALVAAILYVHLVPEAIYATRFHVLMVATVEVDMVRQKPASKQVRSVPPPHHRTPDWQSHHWRGRGLSRLAVLPFQRWWAARGFDHADHLSRWYVPSLYPLPEVLALPSSASPTRLSPSSLRLLGARCSLQRMSEGPTDTSRSPGLLLGKPAAPQRNLLASFAASLLLSCRCPTACGARYSQCTLPSCFQYHQLCAPVVRFVSAPPDFCERSATAWKAATKQETAAMMRAIHKPIPAPKRWTRAKGIWRSDVPLKRHSA